MYRNENISMSIFLSEIFQNNSGQFPGHIRDFFTTFPSHFHEMSGDICKKSPGNFKDISLTFPGHFLENSWTSPGKLEIPWRFTGQT